MGGYARVVSGKRLGKHVPAATDTRATDTRATKEEMCFLCGQCRDVISKGQGYSSVSSVWESVKRGLEPEAEELPLLEPLPGNV
jgi:hypothetical protein